MEEVKVRKTIKRRAAATSRESDGDGHAPVVTFGQWFGIALPEGARADQVKAELRDGVLTVSVPVPEAEKNQAPLEEASKAAHVNA